MFGKKNKIRIQYLEMKMKTAEETQGLLFDRIAENQKEIRLLQNELSEAKEKGKDLDQKLRSAEEELRILRQKLEEQKEALEKAEKEHVSAAQITNEWFYGEEVMNNAREGTT